MGFQSFSEYVWSGLVPFVPSMTEAKLEVMTTRFTVGALFLIDFRIPVVPMIAGSRSC